MKPEPRFLKKPKSFWASVRSLSQHIGYSRGATIIVPTVDRMANAFRELDLDPKQIIQGNTATPLADELFDYFKERATALQNRVEPNLMTAEEARNLFELKKAELKPTRTLPMNKQKGEKRTVAYLTALVNMMIEHHMNGADCDFDPRKLTTITRDGLPVRTLARRVDGAFPSSVNPIAIWEIKEYYYTTTFGSRVADGVYETLLDGMEIEELLEREGIEVKHYLMVDAHYTWWACGKAYLCRMYDMLHMGIVDEILFGREVVEELPRIVKEWVDLASHRGEPGMPEDRG